MDDYKGIEFLDKLYKNLYMSDEVQHTKENKDNRKEAIQKYMDRLEKVHALADIDRKKAMLEKLYFDKYVIKKENIPYDVDRQSIINIQKKSLKMWIDYLGNETTSYPMWAKYWAFQGMLKMGSYDKIKEKYLKRDKKTIAPFVSANPEIIAKSIETIMKLINGEEITIDSVEKLTKTDSFSKIYSLFENKYKKNIVKKSDSNDGKWRKYNQGSKEDAVNLSKSLENMNTGWCTASKDMAIKQLCGSYNDAPDGGDFYVYYTKDKEGKYKIPRIAIRLIDSDKIAEIRGIEEAQNLEKIMFKVLEYKLKEMLFLKSDDVEKNLKILNDLKELTLISKKVEKNIELSDEELTNLYVKQYGFGFEPDPMVAKTLEKRNPLDDFNRSNSNEVKKTIILTGKIPPHYVNDKKLMLDVIRQDGWNLRNDTPEDLRYEREVVFKYASEELRNDKEVMLEAVKQDGLALEYASEKLKNDRKVVLEAVKQDGNALMYASEELWKDKEIVLEAVKKAGCVLECISDKCYTEAGVLLKEKEKESLCNDKEVILEAVKQEGMALKYASEELKNDKEFISEVIKQNGSALNYISKELRNDKEFMLKIENLSNGLQQQERSGMRK